MPRSHDPDADYILDGILSCQLCDGPMEPAQRADGTRAYACAPECQRRADVLAAPIESVAEFAALTRAIVTLCPDLAGVKQANPTTGMVAVVYGAKAERDPEEVRRWERCDLSDRRALLRTAYLRLEVDEAGELHPVRRGETP